MRNLQKVCSLLQNRCAGIAKSCGLCICLLRVPNSMHDYVCQNMSCKGTDKNKTFVKIPNYSLQRSLVITTVFVTEDFAVKSNLLS